MKASDLRGEAKWVISNEHDARNRRAGWMAQLVAGDRLMLAAPSALFNSAREAETFVRQVCSSLPAADVRVALTLTERMAAEEEKQSRMVRLEGTVLRQAREDGWSSGDWADFLGRFDDQQHGVDFDDDDSWAEEVEPSATDPLTWEIQQEGGRPRAVLMRGRVLVLSTVGLVHMEDVEALIEWSRTDAATKAPIERA